MPISPIRRGPPRWMVGLLLVCASAARAPADEFTADVLRRVNAERAAAGLTPLLRAPELDLAALRHTDDMARGGFLSHAGSDGTAPDARIRNAGYTAVTWGENVAAGFPTPEGVVAAWMRSPPHRANILATRFTEIGIAVVYRPGSRWKIYWTQVFGDRLRERPVDTPTDLNSQDPGAAVAAEATTRLLGLVNALRLAEKLPPLSRAPELDRAAYRHARDMADRGFFDHQGSDGSSAGDRIRAAGYPWRAWAENIAAGFPTPEAVLASWLESPPHRANLLSGEMRDIGLAVVADERSPWGIYWTASFGTRTDAR